MEKFWCIKGNNGFFEYTIATTRRGSMWKFFERFLFADQVAAIGDGDRRNKWCSEQWKGIRKLKYKIVRVTVDIREVPHD